MQFKKTNILKIEDILNASLSILDKKPNKAISLAKEAYNISSSIGFTPGIAKAKLRLFQANFFKGDINSALALSKDCIKFYGSNDIDLQDKADLLRWNALL